jgi:hypothetical protein
MVPYTRLNKFRYRIRQVFFTDVACMHPMFSAQLTGKSVARTLIGQDCECGLEIIFAQVDYISLLSLFVTENLQNYNTIIHLNAQFCSRQIVPRGLPMQTRCKEIKNARNNARTVTYLNSLPCRSNIRHGTI